MAALLKRPGIGYRTRLRIIDIMLGFGRVFTRLGAGRVMRWLALQDTRLGCYGWPIIVARSFCWESDIKTGQAVLEENIVAMIEGGNQIASRAGQQGQISSNGTVPLPNKARLRCLDDALEALTLLDVRAFLCFGTLLGFVREGGFMKHDKDLDLGLFSHEASCPAVRHALKQKGFRIEQYEGPDWPCRIHARHPNGMLLDVVFFHQDQRCLLTYVKFAGQLIVRKRACFNLVRATMLGRTVWIPENPEIFLAENYGDWQTPSTYHHYILTSRLTDFSQPLIRYIALDVLYFYLRRRRTSQAQALAALMVQRLPDDPFWMWLQEKIPKGESV